MMKGFGTASLMAVLALGAACTVHKAEAPELAGPSGLAMDITLTATPDTLTQDGASQSAILVTARGPRGEALSGIPVRLDMFVAGQIQDYGSLSARTIVTGSDGKARAIYTAPPPPPANLGGSGIQLTLLATPTGSNAQASPAAGPISADIRLVPPGVILPPAQTPTPRFTTSPTSPVANLPVLFDASTSCAGSAACTSTSGITSFVWDFADGTASANGQRVSHTFTQQGTFNVTLTITNDRGLAASTSTALTVGQPALPTATFTFSPTSPGVGELVFYNGTTSTAGQGHTITSYRWAFGDGASATGANASHAYTTAGTYSVQLTVTDEAGQVTTSAAQTIVVGNPPAPTSTFTVSPTTPAPGQAAVFDASRSTTAQGQFIVDYAWNFGDQTGIQHTSNRTISHTYAVVGTYSVNLVVTDSAGRTGSSSSTVTVGIGPGGLSANFTFSPTSPRVGTTVFFNASGSTGNIVSYKWDYGDGTIETGASPTQTHVYTAAGSYVVRLTVTDSARLTQQVTVTVPVT